MLFYHPLSFYFEIMVLLQQYHLSTFKWNCWCQCLKTRMKHLTLEWKLARRELRYSSWLWMQLIWERAVYKTQEKTWRKRKAAQQYLQIAVPQPNVHLSLLLFLLESLSCVLWLLNDMRSWERVLEASRLDPLLSSSLLPARGFSSAPPLPAPALSQALTSKAKPGGHLDQSPRCWVEATVTSFRTIHTY